MTENAPPLAPRRTVVLVGLMGAGKSSLGRTLAARLSVPFIDADEEIEKAAGLTVAEIFEKYGEPEFRRGEREVMARLLSGPPCVLAAGGGAFMDPDTRALIKGGAVSLWLKADLDLLDARTRGRTHRPLLMKGDSRAILRRLMDERYPVYAQADITFETRDESLDETAERVLAALRDRIYQGKDDPA